LDETSAIKVAEIDAALKKQIESWELADSMVYTTGILKEAMIITGYIRFRNLKM
jgi:hypothetical protein